MGMMGEVATRAFKAVWYAKWFVHRALRPEAFGGLVHMTITHQANYPLHGDILHSSAVQNVFSKFGTYFFPQAFPEGSPQHPSFAQGHASIAGACATILKAAVNGNFPYQSLPNTITPTGPVHTGATTIVTASGDGLSLAPIRARMRAKLQSTAKSTSWPRTSVWHAISQGFTGDRITSGVSGSVRPRP